MILILDFGSQVTQLIARRIREANIYCEIHPFNYVNLDFIEEKGVRGLILSGSPYSIHDEGAPIIDKAIFSLGLPILGICYGQQMMTEILGGKVERPFNKDVKSWSHLPLDTPTDELPAPDQALEQDEDMNREFGFAQLEAIAQSQLTKDIDFTGKQAQVWMSHGDKVTKLADGFKRIARSKGAPFAIIADEERRFYGLQFHPEVVHTVMGKEIIENFVTKICGLSANWTMDNYKQVAMDRIRDQVGDGHVICGLSGGVDSAVTAVLIHQAIGDQLTCILVDHGLMRADEASQVIELFRNHYHINLIHIDASDLFLDALQGQDDPEVKRKTIGRLFIEVFEKEAKKIKDARFLAQGTLYPDVIESVSFQGGPSHTIKSHHNVGGLPEKMNLELVEPLRELFKDEVRKLGRELGMPKDMVMRHPFPGPGLAIRIPGFVSREDCDLLRQVDRIYLEEIRKAGLYDEIWQAFAVLLPVKSVGVMGDGRSYERAVALRAVTSHDGMTAESYAFTHEFLAHTATRIINNVSGVNRVLYDVTSKPPGTIEWE